MKIDFSIVLTSLNGTPIKETSNGEDITLGTVCVNALLTGDDKKQVSGIDKKKRADLAERIYKKSVASLDVKEVDLLKDLVGSLYLPIIVKRAWDLLDPIEDIPKEDVLKV